MRLLPFAACAALIPCALHAQANPDSSENIIVTATRVPTAVDKLPAGVTVIDRRTIEERGYVSLVDALQAVPGLRVVQSGGPGSQASVFIRGTNSNQVLVLRDGVPVNDPSDPGGAFNFGVDTLEDVDRIEVVRGPASSLYGSGAIGGVINLITRRGRGAPHGHLVLAGGNPSQGLAQGDVAGGFGIYDYAANVEGYSTRGFDITPRREQVYTGEADGDRSKSAQLELGTTPLPDTRFSLQLRARDAKYGFDEIGFDSGNATGYDASLFGRLGVTTKFLGGAWQSSLNLSGLNNDRRSTVTSQPQDPSQIQQDDRYHGRRADLQWNNTVTIPDRGPLTASALTFGYEHQNDHADAKNNDAYFGAPSDIGLLRAHGDADAGYLGLQSTAWTRLALTGQLREDATSLSGNAFTYRIGGVLAVPEILSHVRASYGTSFRAAALNDRYGADFFGAFEGVSSFYVGNPNLRPERGEGWEAGGTTDFPAGISVGVEYFHNRIRNLIEIAPVPNTSNFTSVNIDRARTEGLEATLTLHAAAWLQADITYTYTDARDLTTQKPLVRRPYNQGSADLRLAPVRGVVITPALRYVGSFQDYLVSDAGLQGFTPGLSPNGLVVDANVTWQATPAVEVFVWGKNLTHSHFEPASGYQSPGTSVLGGVRLGF